jgi:acrylyl-CoA reductase (NADPH)
MESERWAGAVDSVGGDTLAGLIRNMASRASIAACGVAGGAPFTTSVFPFILRGVNLLGIDSVRVPKAERVEIWSRLEKDLPVALLDSLTQVEPLSRIFELGEQILAGKIRGRTVIDVNA